ncbi:hypothetical protein HJ590_01385 [Naumannella sp. ID2617S]|nr:hypothetical protein [Naumannella sp. ID2617S]
MIHWSPASGAWPTWGAIQQHWAKNGWETGKYGDPLDTKNCYPLGGGTGCQQHFQGGVITWNQIAGAY